MSLPYAIETLLTFDGPNIYLPQPGVLLQVRCATDCRIRLRAALKDGAQFVGLVLGAVETTSEPHSTAGTLVRLCFATPTPALGAELIQALLAGLRAQASADTLADSDDTADDGDPNAPLLALQAHYRRTALPVAALQLLAEARRRHVPVLHLDDGRVQLGYGARGWCFDPTHYRRRLADDDDDPPPALPAPPWPQLGAIPIYAVTGSSARANLVHQVAALLVARGLAPTVLDGASFAMAHAALADPATHLLVVGLDVADVLRRGVPFTHCTRALISDSAPPADLLPRPAPHAWQRALGVPTLLAATPALLDARDPALAEVCAYAPHGVLPLAALAAHLP